MSETINVPLNLWEELGLKDAFGLQSLCDASTKQKTTFGEINENLPYNLSQIHSTGHLFKPVNERIAWHIATAFLFYINTSSSSYSSY